MVYMYVKYEYNLLNVLVTKKKKSSFSSSSVTFEDIELPLELLSI